jgi:hypothetical protein
MIAVAGTGLFCLVLALLSYRLQGFSFGTDNNIFHIPIVLRWFDLPQFSDDIFIQSLRDYATPVYPFLSLFADEKNIATIFFIGFFVTRALTIYALLRIMRACGLQGVRLLAAAAAIVLTSAVYGETAIGRDELFVDIFTHTALAQAIALLGVASLIRGNLTGAAIAAAIAFDLNVMVGVWALAPVALTALTRLATAPSKNVRQILWAAAAFTMISLPVLAWIAATQSFGAPAFDYRDFLIGYYPYHFFIGWARWPDRIAFALQLLSGAVAITLLPRNRGGVALVLGGFVLVFLAGMAVGQLSHSRFFLNLHLLRVDGLVTWLVVSVVASAAFSAFSTTRTVPAIGGIAAITGLIANDWRMVLAGLVLLATVRSIAGKAGRKLPDTPSMKPAALVIAAATFLYAACTHGAYSQAPAPPSPRDIPSDQQLLGAWPAASQWLQVTQWVRANTRSDAMFLIPPKLDFVAAAERRSWVGWKEGAAAMWSPGIYSFWRTRTDEVAALHGISATLTYACQHKIDYVVLDKRPGRALPGVDAITHTAFSNRWFAVVPASGCPKPPPV